MTTTAPDLTRAEKIRREISRLVTERKRKGDAYIESTHAEINDLLDQLDRL